MAETTAERAARYKRALEYFVASANMCVYHRSEEERAASNVTYQHVAEDAQRVLDGEEIEEQS